MFQRVVSWLQDLLREALVPPRLVPARIRRAEPRVFARLSRRPLRRRTFES